MDILADYLPIIGCIALPAQKILIIMRVPIRKLDRGQLIQLYGPAHGKINEPENWIAFLACDDTDQALTNFTNTMLALIAESLCTQVKKQGKKRKFKKPMQQLMQQRENHSKKLKDEPVHSKLSEKVSNIRT